MTLSPAERQVFLDDLDQQDDEDPTLARMRALTRYREARGMTARQHAALLESKGRFDLASLVRDTQARDAWAKEGA